MPVEKNLSLTIHFQNQLTLSELRDLVKQAMNIDGSATVYLQPARGVGDNHSNGMIRVSGPVEGE